VGAVPGGWAAAVRRWVGLGRGSWDNQAGNLRRANPNRNPLGNRSDRNGLRVARAAGGLNRRPQGGGGRACERPGAVMMRAWAGALLPRRWRGRVSSLVCARMNRVLANNPAMNGLRISDAIRKLDDNVQN